MKKSLIFVALVGLLWAVLAYTQNLTCTNVLITNGALTGTCTAPPPPPPPPTTAPSYADPASVLVVEQDNTGPETGTGGVNGGKFVADYYMAKRGIPAGNLVVVATPNIELRNSGPGCKPGQDCDLTHSDSLHINQSDYLTSLAAPIQAALQSPALAGKIKYIALIYGVPTHMFYSPSPGYYQFVSVDSALAALLTGTTILNQVNTYANSGKHIDVSTTKTLLTTRIDGPTAMIAKGLVDNALLGETVGVAGIQYFDWHGLDNTPYDYSMSHAYKVCLTIPAQTCVLNNQQAPPVGTGQMIQAAPNTAFAWGWYDLGASNAAGYKFVPGAVAAQLNSNSANCVRRPECIGDYTAKFLSQGVTATWGAATEPSGFYTMGDFVLANLANGYTFGEATYLSTSTLYWQMIIVGDPLYRPKFLKGL